MSNDPFARFESSRGGWLIPIGLFAVGAVATWIAVNALHDISVANEGAVRSRSKYGRSEFSLLKLDESMLSPNLQPYQLPVPFLESDAS